jgi:predicted flavoprotein YhiN
VDAYNILTMRRKGIQEIYSLGEHYDIQRGQEGGLNLGFCLRYTGMME